MGSTVRDDGDDGLTAAVAEQEGAAPAARVAWRALWPFVLLALLYVAARIAGFAGVTTLAYRDSDSYLEVARHLVISSGFWAGGRPWTVPLLYKLLPDSDEARAIGQLVLSVGCWLALGAAVARCLRPGVYRLVAVAIVLVFSLSFPVIRWERLILSESVSISLTVAVTAAWLELVRTPRPSRIVAVLAVSLLWVFTRDSNGLLALMTAAPAAVWALRPGPIARRWPLGLVGGLVLIFALNVASTATPDAQLRRNERPMLHVIGRRVLVNPSQQAFFERQGMPPPPPRVRRFRKQLAAIGDSIPSDPATDRFLEWVRDDGRATLARFLMTHPRATLGPVVKYRRRLLGGVTEGYRPPDARELLPDPVASALYPRRVGSVMRWLAIVGVVTAAVGFTARPRRPWLVAGGLIALQLPHAVLVYHGDTLEIPRHAILVAVSLRLGILLLAVLVIGQALEAAAARGKTQDASIGRGAGVAPAA